MARPSRANASQAVTHARRVQVNPENGPSRTARALQRPSTVAQTRSPRGTGKNSSPNLEATHAECFRTIEELERENQDLRARLQEAQNSEHSDRLNAIMQQMHGAINNCQQQLWDLDGASALPDATELGNMWTNQEGMGDMEDPNLSTEDMMNLTTL
ncbi:uncharacterized protein LDX57_007886 [Aspergillus melleus]|uniref:uncharacterized protein n=1 Tax=Aspergillus melleus TaxID=138277 RepID=UPI001E8DA991|nr:uncharacterized protein LDX57_007886 [Aspergillus melleus]KAH8430217.1 hypothetical protein LDX57_007886 [Aspergillus melleus]